MKKKELVEFLVDFGLKPKEALVYMTSLSLGPSSVLAIAKESGIKRTTIYSVVSSLKKRGLIKTEVSGLKNVLAAEDPEKLEGTIESKREQLKNILPKLNAIQDLKEGQSFIKYYEGVKGVKMVYDSILDDLKPGDEYLLISDQEQFLKMDEKYFNAFVERRAKLNLKIRTLFQESETARQYKKFERNTNQQIKILPDDIDLTANLVILPNKIIITQIVDPIICILIENKSIVEMHRQQFNIIWRFL